MHQFSDQPKSQIIGRFSRRTLLIGAVALWGLGGIGGQNAVAFECQQMW